MSLSDSLRVSSQSPIPSPTDTPGNTDASDASPHDGAFTGKDQQRPKRPVISQRDLATVRRLLTYDLNESGEPATAKTESCSSEGSGGTPGASTRQQVSGDLWCRRQTAVVSSTDPQVRPLGAPPTTTGGTSTSVVSASVKKEATAQTLALFEGVRRGNRRVFEHVPQQMTTQRSWGIHIDWQDQQTKRTPLTLALVKKEWDIVVELLSLGADPDLLDGKLDIPRELASPMCKMILQFFSWSALKQSGNWSAGKEAVLQELLRGKDSVEGHTMLSWAAGRRHDKLACMLIDAGAGFNLSSKQGEGPFEAACRKGSLSLVLFMLDAWPDLVTSDVGRAYFRLALRAAIEAKRPAVVGEMLSAFRRIYRAGGKPMPEEDAVDLKQRIPRDWRSDAEAYHLFFGGQASTSFGFHTALQRTRDDCLLTPDECQLLMLPEMEMLAVRRGASRVLEVIEAHYKLSSGIPRASTVNIRTRAGAGSDPGDTGGASSDAPGVKPPASTPASAPASTPASTPESSHSQ